MQDEMSVEGTDQEKYNHNPNEGNSPDEHKDCLNLRLKAIYILDLKIDKYNFS